MSVCPQCKKENPLRIDREEEPKLCRECCQKNHVRRNIGGAPA